jgi:hypothetical protein
MRRREGKIQDGAGTAHVAPGDFFRGWVFRVTVKRLQNLGGRMRPPLREWVYEIRPVSLKALIANLAPALESLGENYDDDF